MADLHASYRRRNIVLAIIVGVAIVAALLRVNEGVPADAGPAANAASPTAAVGVVAEGGNRAAISAEVTYAGVVTPARVTAAATAPPHGAVEIPVHIALAPGITLAPDTTVFLIVRAFGGRPMPLAVKRMTIGDLPTDLVLSDADAMVPGGLLGDAGNVEVVARVSMSGGVKASPGDYEGVSGALDPAAISAPVALLIDHAL